MTESIVSSSGRVSHIDYGENLLRSELVEPGRKPYVLARIAVSKAEGYSGLHLRDALQALSNSDEIRNLDPPLSRPLASEIASFLSSGRPISESNFAAHVLLHMAIDEGSRPDNG